MSDKTKIPPGPWTPEHIGAELYHKLAIEYGVCTPSPSYQPALDLTEPFKEQEAANKKPQKKDESAG